MGQSSRDRAGWAAASDRAVWQQCRKVDAVDDDNARYLDLAAFAEDRLDADEREWMAAIVAADSEAAADVAAARALAASLPEAAPEAADDAAREAVVARACALAASEPGRVLRFVPRSRPSLQGVARWSSLAAAIAMAGWLGFAMGSDASQALNQTGLTGEDGFLHELLDPSTGFIGELAEGSQT